MARYVCTVHSPLSAEEAWAAMADVRSYALWDPSIVASRQVSGDGPGPDAVVDLTFMGVGPWRTLRYRVIEFDAPRHMRIEARSTLLHSDDLLTVEPSGTGTGSVVTYDAELRLNGPLTLADPLLRVGFTALSSRADAGLRRYLEERPA
jgi:hypothetical protein